VGSIYFALSKLADEGKIRPASVERDGGRPEKTVYAITETGEAEFLELLRTCLGANEREYHEIDQGIAFLNALKKKETVELFKARVEAIEGAVTALRKHKGETLRRKDVPPEARAIFSHSLKHLEAELAWSREVMADIEAGKFSSTKG